MRVSGPLLPEELARVVRCAVGVLSSPLLLELCVVTRPTDKFTPVQVHLHSAPVERDTVPIDGVRRLMPATFTRVNAQPQSVVWRPDREQLTTTLLEQPSLGSDRYLPRVSLGEYWMVVEEPQYVLSVLDLLS